MVNPDFLKKIDIFEYLNEDRLAVIIDGFEEKDFKEGERLFKEGEKADRIWLVVEGKIDIRFDLPGRVTSDLTTFYSETPGMTFGWSCFVPPFRYILSAYCASEYSKLLQLKKEYMLKLFENDPKLGYIIMFNLARVISSRFHQMQQLKTTGLPYSITKIIVHMGTCGIAAGARGIMNALMDEMSKVDRKDILIESAGCIGKCEYEPIVTVEREGENPVRYKKMTPDAMHQVFQQHILKGEILRESVLE